MLCACDNQNPAKKPQEYSKKISIVSTIKPIQALVVAVTGNSANTEQLIPDYASPHDYSFKPSDIRKLSNADVVFRIDKNMETQLNGAFDNIQNKGELVSLSESAGITLDASSTDKGNFTDFHIWTSPKNALLMATHIANTLSKLDPNKQSIYTQNLDKLGNALRTESDKINTALMPFKNKPYIVFHNSWQYFAKEFGLKEPIVIDIHEGISGGAKTLSDVKNMVIEDNINCIFYDSSVSLARLELLKEYSQTEYIDVLGRDIKMSQTTYTDWLKQLAKQVERCLSH